jgi:putative tryptophan/tyrosine transport system substrate-binding protein
VAADPFFNSRHEQLIELAAHRAVPAIYEFREFPAAGGSDGAMEPTLRTHITRSVFITGRVLNGEHPADLPVQQVTKIELVINLKAAKALGLDAPPTLLARADEVIE